MQYIAISSSILCILACEARSEIITGTYPSEFLVFQEDVSDDLGPAYIEEFGGHLVYDRSVHNLRARYDLFVWRKEPSISIGWLQHTDNYQDPSFELGDRIMDHVSPVGGLAGLRYAEDDVKPDGDHWSMGRLHEMLYVGFVKQSTNPDTMSVEYNYGFLQLFKEEMYTYRVIGWALETDADTDLVTFNLVPSPSSCVLLSFAGLVATRRRR